MLLDRGKTWAQNPADTSIKANLILHNGRIATQAGRQSFAEAVAIKDNRFLAVGSEREVMAYKGDRTELINLNGRTAIPGLNDTHTH
ncbi:MAG: amidohydrolase, partial [Bacteroidota bacterium]